MKSNRTTAVLIGILYILAAVTAIVAVVLYQPILAGADFLVSGAQNANQIVMGALNELVLAVSIMGIAVLFFPFFKKQNESMAFGYVLFRMFEAVLIVVGIVSMLAVLTLGQIFMANPGADASAYQIAGKALIAVHDWTFILGVNFMLAWSTFLCATLLYQMKLVPRFIAVMGFIGAGCIFTAAILEMFGITQPFSTLGGLLGMPIFAYEMTLAVWLIVKGFSAAAVSQTYTQEIAPALAQH